MAKAKSTRYTVKTEEIQKWRRTNEFQYEGRIMHAENDLQNQLIECCARKTQIQFTNGFIVLEKRKRFKIGRTAKKASLSYEPELMSELSIFS